MTAFEISGGGAEDLGPEELMTAYEVILNHAHGGKCIDSGVYVRVVPPHLVAELGYDKIWTSATAVEGDNPGTGALPSTTYIAGIAAQRAVQLPVFNNEDTLGIISVDEVRFLDFEPVEVRLPDGTSGVEISLITEGMLSDNFLEEVEVTPLTLDELRIVLGVIKPQEAGQ